MEDIARWREDMNFMFEWQEQYLAQFFSGCRYPDETLSLVLDKLRIRS